MGTITLKGAPIHTVGALPSKGKEAPDFTATKPDLSEVKLKNLLGKKVILNIFPSMDTPTCATAMQRFNEIASHFPEAVFLCISADLPFAQERFCAMKNLNNVQPVSVFRRPEFGRDYGVMIKDGAVAGLLSRAVVVIDETGKVTYTEQVEELSNEPDYAAMMTALKQT